MRKLHIRVEEELQGNFSLQKLNLLLIFQVNCPGCFTHALPLFNELFEQYKNQLGFLALSTAFEDFDINTKENTKALLEKGELVGETKKMLNQYGKEKLPYPIHFPVAMDEKMKTPDKNSVIENICYLNPDFQIWPDYDKNLMRERISEYLDQQSEISLTFTSNQLKGSPTLVLLNEKSELLQSWFGHVQKEMITEKIQIFID